MSTISDESKGPFMEYLRGKITQDTANTFKQLTIPTPSSKTEKMAMLIQEIEIQFDPFDTLVNLGRIQIQFTNGSKAAIVDYEDVNMLQSFQRRISYDTSGLAIEMQEVVRKFSPSMLYSKAQIYLGINTTGQTNPLTINYRIGYTLKKVPADQFIDALVEG